MASNNETTLGVYERNFDKYIEGTVRETGLDHFQGRWIADVLAHIPKDGKILEIGSAFGRDADFIKTLGYAPELTDAIDAAVEHLVASGHDARKLNILTDELEGTYDLILASAVLLHFSEEEFRFVLERLKRNLTSDSVFAFSLKNGDGEEWSSHKMGEARYFRYWRAEEVTCFLEKADYSLLDVRESDDQKWLHFMAQLKGDA